MQRNARFVLIYCHIQALSILFTPEYNSQCTKKNNTYDGLLSCHSALVAVYLLCFYIA